MHKAHGDTVVVVSAALDAYLTEWCKSAGVELICTELEEANGVLTGRYMRGDCTGTEKLRRIRAKYALEEFEAVYAYGDTNEDLAMLNLADRKFFRWREMQGDITWQPNADRVDVEPQR